ncbi:MAG: putative metal-dependent hydrolase [Gemmatimonadetes bacterium]|nr:putative metal-dependent hydrolase [Gemmatimonadota bacterium]
MSDLRYPIGKFQAPRQVTPELRARFVGEIEKAPAAVRAAVEGLSEKQLDTPYRPGGWTVRQVAHHLPDSHLNAYTRMKLAVTEDQPTIKTYEEARWAELADARTAPIKLSLQLLDALHARWVIFLRSLAPDHFARPFRHPEHGNVNIDWALAMYAWHGKHHVAHITSLREREGWH